MNSRTPAATTSRHRFTPRQSLALSVALALVAGVLAFSTPSIAEPDDPILWPDNDTAAIQLIEQLEDGPVAFDDVDVAGGLGPPPWTSWIPNRDPATIFAWRELANQLQPTGANQQLQQFGDELIGYSEAEPALETGVNDTIETGELIAGLGTGDGDASVVNLQGVLAPPEPPTPPLDCPSVEDDGAIPQANPVPLQPEFMGLLLCGGTLGDGPFGQSSGDFEFFAIDALAGDEIVFDVGTFGNPANLPEVLLGLYGPDGTLLTTAEDGSFNFIDRFLTFIAVDDGTHHVVVAGCCELLADPTDSSSGNGVTTTGDWLALVGAIPPPPPLEVNCPSIEPDGAIGLANIIEEPGISLCGGFLGDGEFGDTSGDLEFFAIDAAAGEEIIFDVGTNNPANPLPEVILGLYDPSGALVSTALDGGDDFVVRLLSHIAESDGTYHVVVAGCCELPADPTDPSSGAGATTVGEWFAFAGATPPPPPPCTSVEDDGAIQLANPLSFEIFGVCFGALGDGPHAAAGGDFDFYAIDVPDLGDGFAQFLTMRSSAADGTTPFLNLYDPSGALVASGSETIGAPEPVPGTWTVSISGCCGSLGDPSDPASGPGINVELTPYALEVELAQVGGPIIVEPPAEIPPVGEPPVGEQAQLLRWSAVADTSPVAAQSWAGSFNGERAQQPIPIPEPDQEPIPPIEECIVSEDDGSLGLANVIEFVAAPEVFCSAVLGDGPFGNSSGDFDFYDIGFYEERQLGIVDVFNLPVAIEPGDEPPQPIPPSEFTVEVMTATGEIVLSSSGLGGAFIEFEAPLGVQLFARVRDANSTQLDPFDSSSGTGAGPVAPYGAVFVKGPVAPEPVPTDTDVFLVDLEAGDVMRADFVNPAFDLTIVEPDGTVVQGSTASLSFLYPDTSPLFGLGDSGVDHVADVTGRHAVIVTGDPGPYLGTLKVYRAGLSNFDNDDQQILFLDFDGAFVEPSAFDPFVPAGEVELSPLAAFLADWGLDPSDENAVIDAIVAQVEEDFNESLPIDGRNGDRDASGVGGEFDVEILTSRDGDLWGQPNVTRVVIGGTIGELTLPTVGIAESIDPGNFDTTETGIVLLDALSAPEGEPLGPPTLNDVEIGGDATIIDLIGRGVGLIASHEAGHLLGNWHTDEQNPTPNIMDSGGNLPGLLGLGPDGVFGTDDDIDVDHAEDVYQPFEGLFGLEDSASRTAIALSTGLVDIAPEPEGLTPGRYILENVDRGRNLHVGAGDNVDTATTDGPSAQWDLSQVGERWLLRNVATGLYLDADRASQDWNVETSTSPSLDDEWSIQPLDGADGIWLLQNADTGRWLDADGANRAWNVDQSTSPALDDQWIIRPVEPGDGGGPDDFVGEVVEIQNESNGRWLDADPDRNADTSDSLADDVRWEVQDGGDGTVLFLNLTTGRWLDADADNDVDTSSAPSDDDRWRIVDLGDGRFHIVNELYGRWLDADGAENDFEAEMSTSPRADDVWLIDVLGPPG